MIVYAPSCIDKCFSKKSQLGLIFEISSHKLFMATSSIIDNWFARQGILLSFDLVEYP